MYFIVSHFYHEPPAREIGQPLPVYLTVNKLYLYLYWLWVTRSTEQYETWKWSAGRLNVDGKGLTLKQNTRIYVHRWRKIASTAILRRKGRTCQHTWTLVQNKGSLVQTANWIWQWIFEQTIDSCTTCSPQWSAPSTVEQACRG